MVTIDQRKHGAYLIGLTGVKFEVKSVEGGSFYGTTLCTLQLIQSYSVRLNSTYTPPNFSMTRISSLDNRLMFFFMLCEAFDVGLNPEN